MNLMLLFGAEVDAELERARQLQAGIKAEDALQLPPRDSTASTKRLGKQQVLIAEGRQLRRSLQEERPEPRGGTDPQDLKVTNPASPGPCWISHNQLF